MFSITPAHWRKVQNFKSLAHWVCHKTALNFTNINNKKLCSVFLLCALFCVPVIDQCKSTGAKFAHKITISITFYKLHMQIPNEKNTVKSSAFFALLGSEHVKSVHKMMMNLTRCLQSSIFLNYLWMSVRSCVKVTKSLFSFEPMLCTNVPLNLWRQRDDAMLMMNVTVPGKNKYIQND